MLGQQNCISAIEGLAGCTSLQTLILGDNRVTFEGVAQVLEVPSITCLDLQNNSIDDPAVGGVCVAPLPPTDTHARTDVPPPCVSHACACMRPARPVLYCSVLGLFMQVLEILVQLPAIAVLYLQGNSCVKKIPYYRKVVIARMPHLKYLDDRPVFEDERLRAEAWCVGLTGTHIYSTRHTVRLGHTLALGARGGASSVEACCLLCFPP